MSARPVQPLASVVLTTYNRRALVPRAIRSVLAQSYSAWELIIIDDGSTDGTYRDLFTLARRHPNIRCVVHQNRGLAAARNEGIALARGLYVTFLDSDDEYLPSHLEYRVGLMERRRDVDFVVGGFALRGPKENRYVIDMEHPGSMIHLSHCLPGATLFARTSVLRKAGGIPEMKFAEDYWFIRKLFRRHRGLQVSRRTYLYHCDSNNRLCEVFSRKALARTR